MNRLMQKHVDGGAHVESHSFEDFLSLTFGVGISADGDGCASHSYSPFFSYRMANVLILYNSVSVLNSLFNHALTIQRLTSR
jgi:hypothetical protein